MSKTRYGYGGLSLWLSLVGLGAQPPDTVLKIEVHIYNYSKVPHEMLVRAEQESARIFERIGIATIWLDCPLTSQEAVRNKACALPSAPMRFTLRLLSNSMADSFGGGGDIFGSALLPANEGFGVVANVYADRTRELADGREFEVILGRVIAHELGHLLLGKNAHSGAGIMHARWRAQDLRLSRQAAMLFLPGEAKRIRAQVFARTGADITGQVYDRSRVEPPTLTAAVGEATEGIRSAQDTIPSPTPQYSQAIGLYNQSIFGQEQGRYVEDDAAFCKGLQASEKLPEPSSEEIAAQQQLTIKVYNYSPATSQTIRHAEGEAGRILLEAGIHVIWLSCRPTPAEETATRACRADSLMSPILRIAPHAIESLGRLTLGFTLPAPGGAINATVVYSRVQELVSNRVDSEQKIFGCGIAHEIGHVLLGPEHSLSGLMRAQWHTSDWRLADVEQLRFSPQEAIAMGAEVVRRTKQTTDKTCPAGR